LNSIILPFAQFRSITLFSGEAGIDVSSVRVGGDQSRKPVYAKNLCQ